MYLNRSTEGFQHNEITPEMILASACLPYLYQAIEIDGEYYWDGGYMGNPPIFLLFIKRIVTMFVIVHGFRSTFRKCLKALIQFLTAFNTLSFNSSLMREMRGDSFCHFFNRKRRTGFPQYKLTHIHTIDAEEEMSKLTTSSKMNLDMEFLKYLFDTGQEKTDNFLQEHFDKIGKKSSTDIAAKFL